jgi:hypothetical protein
MDGDEGLLGESESSRSRCLGSLRGTVFSLFPRSKVAVSGRCLLYGRNGVLEADALLDHSWLSRALSFNAAATTSADDSADRFNGVWTGGSLGAGYSLLDEHDCDSEAAEGAAELEDRLICRLSFSILCKVFKAGREGGGVGKCRGEALRR